MVEFLERQFPTWQHRLIYVPLALLAGFLLSSGVSYFWNLVDTTPPVTFHSVKVLNSPLRHGSNLKVVLYRDKVRDDCPVTSLRHVIRDDGEFFEIPDAAWKGGPVGHALPFEYVTSHLPVGKYTMYVDLTYVCPGGFVFNVDQPDIKFEVVQ